MTTAPQRSIAAQHPSGEDHGSRIGGDVVLEALTALGARAVVGLPGQHALGLFDALRRSELAYLSARVENNAGFMADGLARETGAVAPLLLSTGPGALTSLAALQEAAASSIPVLAISAQIPVAGLGGGRHGYLHELPQQSDSFRGVVKHVRTVRTMGQIPTALAEAWRIAATAPQGPVLVEVPQDILLAPADDLVPDLTRSALVAAPTLLPPLAETIALAASVLGGAERPVIFAGGGVVRAGAQAELAALAERLDAPVVTTIGGKSAIPWEHPLSARSWIEDIATTEFLESADALLIVGSGVGELSSNYHTLRPRGRVIHVEADLGKVNSNHAGIGIHADARLALAALDDALSVAGRSSDAARRADAVERIGGLLTRVFERVEGQGLDAELGLVRGMRAAVPAGTHVYWDMTILAYWAWSAWDPRGVEFASAQGAGGLGYGFPAALGAAFGRRAQGQGGSVLAVSGDGGALYGIAELAVAAQHELPVVWLIIDDGGYGVLREYMRGAFGAATATELARPDYVALAESFGIPAERTTIGAAPAAVARALDAGGAARGRAARGAGALRAHPPRSTRRGCRVTRPLVLFTDRTDLDPEPGRSLLEEAGCDTLLLDLPTRAGEPQELPVGAEGAVALVVGYARIDAGLLDRLPNVGCIATMSAGFDMIDRAACEARGIWIVNLVDAATEEVAAHALTLMLALERQLRGGLAVTARGGWTDDVAEVPRRLSSLTLGLYGFGRIARRFAEIAAPVVGRVIAHDPYAVDPDGGVELVPRERLLAESDVLSLHAPLTPETAGALDIAAFAAMREGASLINVSRGELIDVLALRGALDSGRLRGAALDVLAGEPPAPSDPLRTDPRVLVTPHVAFLSTGSLEHYTLDPAAHVLAWLQNGRLERVAVRGAARTPLLG